MKVICFASPKGGVGKTTLTANLAFALQGLGLKVTVIDFDPQNSLRLHFGMALDDERGFVAKGLQKYNWRNLTIATSSGVRLLPYGDVSEAQRRHFESQLEDDPNLLAKQLKQLCDEPGRVLLVDTAPGPTAALKAITQTMHPIQVAVLAADSASLALLPSVEGGRFFGTGSPSHYVLNMCEMRSALSRDILMMLKRRLGSSLLGIVHHDEAVLESHALQCSVFQHAASSAAAEDLEQIANRLHSLLLLRERKKSESKRLDLALATGEA